MEYNFLLDQACKTQDPLERMAIVTIYIISTITVCEKTTTKPFNPLLGETYEFCNDDFEYLSEQVSHHPPVTACYCKGKKSNYVYWTNQKTNISFNGKNMTMTQQYLAYVDLPDFNERYQVHLPQLSLHNFIIGTPYVDIGDSMEVIKVDSNLKSIIEFHKRGWFAKDKDVAKLDGYVYTVIDNGKKKPTLRKEVAVYGNWDKSCYMQRVYPTKGSEVHIWTKVPYPEQVAFLYGMSHFSLQLNYFPKRLHNKVAPTDTRRRPDQRALENGDMKAAADHKDFLEQKQRAVRKYKEDNGVAHQAQYFDSWENPADGQTYY